MTERSPEYGKHSSVIIEGVPLIKQAHHNWCGYASLAIVLQYAGFAVTPVSLFEKIHYPQKYDKDREADHDNRTIAPSASTLALTGQEITANQGFQVDLLHGGTHDLHKKIHPDRTPYRYLDGYLRAGIPTIVRLPGHFVVVTGYYENKFGKTYLTNDPLTGIALERDAQGFESSWQKEEKDYPDNDNPMSTRHLMIAIRKKKDK